MNIRKEIVDVNYKINNKGGFSSEIIKKKNFKDFSNNDKKLFINIVYGTIENLIYLDYIISRYSKYNLSKMNKYILEILRMSVYQIIFMDKIPSYAIVNEAVEIAKNNVSVNDSKFVNAILKNIINSTIEELDIDLRFIKSQNKKLSVKYSINKELLDMLLNDYSKKTVKKILKSFFNKDTFTIKVNTNAICKNNLIKSLELKGYELFENPNLEDILIVNNPFEITETDEFKNGYFLIQDSGSYLISKTLNPSKNSMVLDICAAPGSKTCNLSEIMKNTGKIVANDINKKRIKKINDNIIKYGCNNIELTNFDATKCIEKFENTFDYILIDAPCSGLGIVRSKPEIKIVRNKKDINNLVNIQREIINNSIKYLKVGGTLVYSTCSILNRENEDQMNWILKKFPNLEKKEIFYKGNYRDYIKIMPYEEYSKGFFMVKFKKI